MIVVHDKPEPLAMQVTQTYSHEQGSTNYNGRRCEYYHFIGHTNENYFKLIGYPTDWKQRNKQGYTANNSKKYASGNNYIGNGRKQSHTTNMVEGQFDAATFSHDMSHAPLAKGHTFTEEEQT